MLPRSRAPLMRVPHRHNRLPLLPIVLATVFVMPFLVWIFLFPSPAKPDTKGSPPLLEKLKEQGLGGQQLKTAAGAAAAGSLASSQARASQVFSWVPPEHIAAANRYREEAVLNPRKRPAVPSADYVIDSEPHDMRAQHKKVKDYLVSAAHKAKVAARTAAGKRGIIINAGGPSLLTSSMVTLKVLREQLNCTLPVELVWHTGIEMDNITLAAIQAQWGPVIGVNLSGISWPEQHRPQLLPRGQPPNKFIGKVRSLTVSSFTSALLLDADNLPLRNPEVLWEEAAFKSQGNLFWPDFWSAKPETQEVVHDIVGLKHPQAADLLSAGKGQLQQRYTEAGQILLDLVRHADVAELALWINTFTDSDVKFLWGDKDTYALAFAAAGKAHEFTQTQVPPGGAFTWRPNKLLIKAANSTEAGYQLAAMVQFDAAGQPMFLHRTMNKFNWKGEAWPLQLLTGPLSSRWINYYLSHDAHGPTVGVPYDYVAPAAAFVAWKIPQAVNRSAVQDGDKLQVAVEEACPTATFTTYWRLREHAVPIGTDFMLEEACQPFLKHLLGPSAEAYTNAGLNENPELLEISQTEFGVVAMTRSNPNPLAPDVEVPDSTAALAWEADYTKPAAETNVARVLRASYEAFLWIERNAERFPVFNTVSSTGVEQLLNQDSAPMALLGNSSNDGAVAAF